MYRTIVLYIILFGNMGLGEILLYFALLGLILILCGFFLCLYYYFIIVMIVLNCLFNYIRFFGKGISL